MGVTRALARRVSRTLARWAVRRPHVLMVAGPGSTGLRLEAEAALAALGGRAAHTPADADVLLQLGALSRLLGDAAEELWAQMPGPRVRVNVSVPGQVERALRDALPRLSAPEQETDARSRDDEWQRDGGGREEQEEHERHGEHEGGGGDDAHDAHEAHGAHGAHGGHGEMPGGLSMAGVAADRDGLRLDVLHVPLGPVLPSWPPGLVIDVRLQGDVVQEAEARLVGSEVSAVVPFWCDAVDPAGLRRRVAAGHLDSMARLLAVAGWGRAQSEAVRLRDMLLSGDAVGRVQQDFGRWRRRVESSVLLRRATDGLGVLTPARAGELGVGGPAGRAGEPWDTTARWQRWLAETAALLSGERVPEGGPRGEPDPVRPPSGGLLAAVVELMPGLDLLDARLLMAGFDPDPDELARAPHGAGKPAGGAG